MNAKGKLYLIPCMLGDNSPLEVLPLLVKKAVENIDNYVVEHEKTARRFIKKLAPKKPQSSLHFSTINKFTNELEIPSLLSPCMQGIDVGIISDAGCPGIADPGAQLVAYAHSQGVKVAPLVGPSAILLAMMASGFNGQNFAFNGYLPIDKKERQKVIKSLEKQSFEKKQSQIFIETPYRNNQMLEALVSTLHKSTALSIACDITLPTEFIKTAPIDYWKKSKLDLNKRPTIFIIQR